MGYPGARLVDHTMRRTCGSNPSVHGGLGCGHGGHGKGDVERGGAGGAKWEVLPSISRVREMRDREF